MRSMLSLEHRYTQTHTKLRDGSPRLHHTSAAAHNTCLLVMAYSNSSESGAEQPDLANSKAQELQSPGIDQGPNENEQVTQM